MDEKPDAAPDDHRQRIADLEAEVARLRRAAGEAPADAAREADGAPREAGAPRLGPAPRGKMILVALVVLVVALGAFFAVFVALSQGFSSFANKAAKVFVPGGDASPSRPAPREPARPADRPAPAVPGI